MLCFIFSALHGVVPDQRFKTKSLKILTHLSNSIPRTELSNSKARRKVRPTKFNNDLREKILQPESNGPARPAGGRPAACMRSVCASGGRRRVALQQTGNSATEEANGSKRAANCWQGHWRQAVSDTAERAGSRVPVTVARGLPPWGVGGQRKRKARDTRAGAQAWNPWNVTRMKKKSAGPRPAGPARAARANRLIRASWPGREGRARGRRRVSRARRWCPAA